MSAQQTATKKMIFTFQEKITVSITYSNQICREPIVDKKLKPGAFSRTAKSRPLWCCWPASRLKASSLRSAMIAYQAARRTGNGVNMGVFVVERFSAAGGSSRQWRVDVTNW